MPETTENQREAPPKSIPLMIAAALAAGGIGVAYYLVSAKLSLENDPNFKSACNFGDKLNCDVVQTSDYATILGLPLGLYAMPTYALMVFLAWMGLRSAPSRERPNAAQTARTATAALGGLALLTVVFSLYLAYVSSVVLGAFCVFCITLYAINFGSLGMAVWALGDGFAGLVRSALRAVSAFQQPLLASLGVFLVAFAGAYGLYSGMRSSMQESYKQQIDAVFAAEEEEYEEVVEPVAVAAANTQGAASPSSDAPAAARAAGAQADAPTGNSLVRTRKRPKAKKTENGLSYFEMEVRPDDWAKGPADAPVTVVKFADFECGYCRILHYNMKPLVDKYPTQVRWVMKHYPMNADCNPRMGGERMHPNACVASFASHCAGAQGKFWEMHDKLYDNQQKLDEPSVRSYAESLGLDMAKYDACMKDPSTKAKIGDDIKLAGQAFIYGTPRAYVNGRLVSGSASTSILEYYIQKSLEDAASSDTTPEEAVAKAADASSPTMVKATKASGEFWIDAFESSITKDGKAVSLPNVEPAQASWFQAKEACEKAGKRLCTEEEWVSACAGKPAVDENKNGFYADDDVEGRMYPYGLFYEAGICRDGEDEYKGQPTKTGSLTGCRTPDGIYDLAGNLGEWVEQESARATLAGGDWRGGERSACNRRSNTFGAGQRNNSTGFRCCADARVDQPAVAEGDLLSNQGNVVGAALPQFQLDLMGGGKFDTKSLAGKVTYLTFFAAWCGSCKRELPELNKWNEAYKDRGFQVVAVGVDKVAQQSEDFAKPFTPNYPVAFDPEASVMGMFDINAMPTSYIVDRQGVVRYKEVGFKAEEVHLVKTRIETLLNQK
jgi:protein-disulfide isomerase/uncharacterized membrane protein/peroxiredoxin